jgi:hypothetical protein
MILIQCSQKPIKLDADGTTQDNIDQHEDLNKLNKHAKNFNQIKIKSSIKICYI